MPSHVLAPVLLAAHNPKNSPLAHQIGHYATPTEGAVFILVVLLALIVGPVVSVLSR